MAYDAFKKFLEAPAPGFRCSGAGSARGEYLARVQHILNPPAQAESIARIHQMLGNYAEQAAAFYQHHNGFALYRDTKSEIAGIELLPVELWAEATEDMRTWFDFLAAEPENDPDRILTGVAIGTVPESGNYFVMPVEGPSAGKIYYANHDGWYESAFADDFGGFLARVAREPVKLLVDDVGCYTRYSDGRSHTQWIPEEYFPDITKVQL